MNTRPLERAVWVGAVAVASVIVQGWSRGAKHVSIAQPISWPAPMLSTALSPDSATVLAERIADSDPFRLDRRPAATPYRPDRGESAPPAAIAKAPKPALALAGIVGGPPWAAVLDGVPGRATSVLVHSGDTLSGLRIRAVTARGISVIGMDTVWRLSMQRPWQ